MRGDSLDLDEGCYPGEGQGAAGWCFVGAILIAVALVVGAFAEWIPS